MIALFFSLFLAFVASTTASKKKNCPKYTFIPFSGSAKDAKGLEPVVNKFRAALGAPNNMNSIGPFAKGHREINWDAPGNILPFDMPGDFFDRVITRGAVFATRTDEFRVSNPAPAKPDDDRFNSIVSSGVAGGFQTFSDPRLFTPLVRNRVIINFRVPGLGKTANVTGFGAIFTDVDVPRQTYVKIYDANLCVIAKVFLPPLDRGLSFGGAIAINPKNRKNLAIVHQVDLNFGTISISDFAKKFPRTPNDFKLKEDVVVADNFIYGEPQDAQKGSKRPVKPPKPFVKPPKPPIKPRKPPITRKPSVKPTKPPSKPPKPIVFNPPPTGGGGGY